MMYSTLARENILDFQVRTSVGKMVHNFIIKHRIGRDIYEIYAQFNIEGNNNYRFRVVDFGRKNAFDCFITGNEFILYGDNFSGENFIIPLELFDNLNSIWNCKNDIRYEKLLSFACGLYLMCAHLTSLEEGEHSPQINILCINSIRQL